MKAITMILLTFFLGKGCSNEAQNDIQNSVIQYDAATRGFHLKIIIANQVASISQGRTPDNMTQSQVKISDADWKEMIESFGKIDLEKLAELKDPTQKRQYDGAAAANLKVRYQEKNYETTSFDHGFPPAEIEKFVGKIVSLYKQE
jgi:tyrosyl-tRNA synthetase